MKKSKKGEVGSLFDSIKQTPAPIQDPLKSEKFYSADGERMTRITYRLNPNPVEVSADKLMEGAQIYPGFLISRDPWHSILPWLESPEGVIKKFWECYKREEAETGRKIAIDGSKSCNRSNERNLLNAAHEYKALSLQKYGLELGKDELPSVLANAGLSEGDRSAAMAKLEEKMVDWVLEAIWNDPEAPKRLHELLKNKSAVKSEYSDQPTVHGRIFHAFVLELTAHLSLPTKKAVRIGAKVGKIAAARAFGDLGLAGLPEG